MLTLTLRRAVHLIPVLFGLTIVVFLLIHFIPGDPARTMLGVRANPASVAALRSKWGLDKPLPVQYARYAARTIRGDLGESLFYQVPVRTLVGERVAPTFWMIGYGALLAVLIAVPLAAISASKPNGLRDQVIRAVPLVGFGMPAVWIGVVLILLLGVKAQLLPVGGYGNGFIGHLRYMFLPALTIALGLAPILIRSLRASMLTALRADYVLTARSKGIRERDVLIHHVMRNAIITTVTILGVNIGFLLSGTVVVEKVFAVPGIGSLMIDAISQRDFPIVQSLTLVFGVLVIAINLLTDVAYILLDPRVTLG